MAIFRNIFTFYRTKMSLTKVTFEAEDTRLHKRVWCSDVVADPFSLLVQNLRT